jgi:hypothetical protein
MKFENGQCVDYKGFTGYIKFIDASCVCIAKPSVIGNPWPITVVVHRSDFKNIHEISSDL